MLGARGAEARSEEEETMAMDSFFGGEVGEKQEGAGEPDGVDWERRGAPGGVQEGCKYPIWQKFQHV